GRARRRGRGVAHAHAHDRGRRGGGAVSLPAWLQGLPDPERMRATDAWAIQERGIPGLELMERAGRGLAEVVAAIAPAGPIAVVCGKGHTRGDGYTPPRGARRP